jgi:hypothetical protein
VDVDLDITDGLDVYVEEDNNNWSGWSRWSCW